MCVFVWIFLKKGHVGVQVSSICVKISMQQKRGIFVTLNSFNCTAGHNDFDANSSSGLVSVKDRQDCPWVELMRQDLPNFLTSCREPPHDLVSCSGWYDIPCEDMVSMDCK